MVENLRTRRRRINYLLSSESVGILNQMIGKTINKFMLGTRYVSKEMLFERNGVDDFSDLIYKSQGGPFLISCEQGKVIILYDDDFLGSIVLRELWFDVDDGRFFDALELEDKVGVRGSVKHAIDLSAGFNLVGKVIDKISIYKLPVNFIRDPHAYDLLNECVLCFDVRDVGDVLFVCEISENGGPPDIRVSTWDRLNKDVVSHLTCIWSSSGQHSGAPVQS
ncbi:hypothetical protein GN109_14795 [Collimonas pratensis]|uniref:hypothetical protein n=1 Tax=Collimonas pratensis TaxID=279113 RepID=UPI00143D958B|nr:hypothetical protein [Collimonas pratensis]NKI70689.1 hypothetical protein [Collimonas pratensis]